MEYILAIGLFFIALTCHTAYGIVYRLYLSPLASFPGPKLAALTFWYEFYYDVVLWGRYTWKIAELHEEYGPIIRITPHELHINDPDYYDELYVGPSKRKTDIYDRTVPMFGSPESVMSTVDHDIHRRRRNAYSTYFSKQSIKTYSAVIQSCVDKLCVRFEEHQAKGATINLNNAFSNLAGEVISGYCYPTSYGLLDQAEFTPDFHNMFESFIGNVHLVKNYPWIFPVFMRFPARLVEYLMPAMSLAFKQKKRWAQEALDLKAGIQDMKKDQGKPSVFETLLESDLPPEDKSISRLVDESALLLAAGTVTTAMTLTLATYYTLSNPEIHSTVLKELATITESSNRDSRLPPLADLEKLEYLTAIILETLRVSGISHRLQRVSPDQTLHYHDWAIPPGTPVGMTSMHFHTNAAIFPNPERFEPERWLPLATEGKRLQKYFFAFARGSRNCLGMNLAWAEIYMALTAVFVRFGAKMVVVDTRWERDVELVHDLFSSVPRKEGTGVKIRIGKA